MVLPPAHEAAAWFVDAARAALAAGGPLDVDAVELLIQLAPGDPIVAAAIDRLERGSCASPRTDEPANPRTDEPANLRTSEPTNPPRPVEIAARAASARLRAAAAGGDERLARDALTDLEVEVLRVYRPSHGLGRFDEDVAVALAMLDAHAVGGDEVHVMMAEELLLGVVRRYWAHRGRCSLRANCEAAIAFARLAARTGRPEYRERALEVLEGYAGTYRALGVGAAPYVSALRALADAGSPA